MKLSLYRNLVAALFFLIVSSSCHQADKSDQTLVKFNEVNFIKIKEIMGKEGKIAVRVYVNRTDTSLIMIKQWWDNGNMVSKDFFRKGMQFGPSIMNDYDGSLKYEGFYLNNKMEGTAIWYDKGKLRSIELYHKGRRMTPDSAVEAELMDALSK